MILDTKKMKSLRTALKLNQDQAAKKSGLHGRADWSVIETGKRANITLATLQRIAKTLGVSARDLLK